MNKKLPLLFLGLVMYFAAGAQQIITGKVSSAENGDPVPGVTVAVKGTSSATQTDPDGNYEIAAAEGQVLVFSFLGLTTVERTVGTSNTIDISMASDPEALEEVVVVGYGTQKRENLTGAVATIDVQENLEGRPIADVGRAIQGTTPGLSVVVPSGEVGSDPIIKIRGQIASLRGGISPLILLDNVEIPSIQLVNPLDVKSITVLKDAASSSIYGSKAAFGVVLITTKDGQGLQGTLVGYSNNFSFQNAAKEIDMADVNALKYSVDAFERIDETATGAFYKVNRESYERAVAWKEQYGGSIGMDDPTVYGRDWYFDPARNWKFGIRTYDPYEAMIREWAPTQTHNLSVGGREGNTSYNIGLGLLDQSGMMKPAETDQFSRYNASLRVKSEINEYFTARAGALYSRRNKEHPYITSSTTADPWLYLYRWSPLYPLGNDENGDPIRSPASEAAAANTASMLHDYINVNLGGTVNITDDWKVDFDYAFSNQKYNELNPGTKYTARNSWVAPQARLDENGNQLYVNEEGQTVPASDPNAMPAYDLGLETYTADGANPDHINETSANFNRHTINAYTTYELAVREDHDFKFILGLNRVTEDIKSHFTQVTNLTNILNPQFNYGIGTWTGGGNESWEAQLGYFGRVNYDFRDKYLLEANLRYDGSSKFPTDLKWRWFPSFSAGWVLSEEEFMAGTERILNLLKFRGSWGTIGDQTVPNSLYVPTMETGLSTWIGANGSRLSYVGTPNAVSTSITWQDITSLNVGLDARLFDNRFGVTFDWFQRNTENMIVPIEGIPPTFGAGAPQTNLGGLETKGWELAVDFNHLFDNGLGIYFRANISDSKSTITSFGTAKGVDGWYAGKTYGEIWGYRTDRLYQKDDFELDADGNPQLITLTEAESELYAGDKANKLKGSNPVYQTYLQNSSDFYFGPGDVKFVDLNGDGEINAGSRQIDDHGDLEVIGNFNPRYEYGFRFGADYKGIDFGIFFQGVGKREIWGNGSLAIAGYHTSDGAMPSTIVDNYWTPENTNAFYPAAFNNGGSNGANNMQVQSRYLLDMSYLRIKNITLGYSFPASLLENVRVKTARIYVALENFVTWDNLNGLPFDPEVINGYSMFNSSNYNLSRTGVGTPTFKSVSFGVQLNF
ncbi:TonB-linked SusC/RagA family outer membrane protein [Anseongella ginsenosidimutans]|uniref:TonB-linked SusC/RagA family outer membrane protein n=1 Tax=Anseongella ginsenosidimutans TaxID=496056 RepID=A0A4R3KY00_9SPHI|nr:SusC/RagA family TonB-linked outer membrane protein [Anseongella ginsenosidimutans]QEC51532.1 SusC/RagA family TonB-linked outer membrane protein [Anseongella ginsenosidimutans]TCS88852.1 TonB-linked SusC/RagA family outer membrane protein [Anseongella ginsenosidimutans]